MFDSAFTALKGLLSRSFIVSAFLPVFIALAINITFFGLATDGVTDTIAYAKDHLNIADFATAFGLLTLASLPLAFALSPLLGSFRILLEGERWWGWIRHFYVAGVQRRAGSLELKAEAADAYLTNYRAGFDAAKKAIPEAVKKGNKLCVLGNPKLIKKAAVAVRAFEDALGDVSVDLPSRYLSSTTAALAKFREAHDALLAAFSANSTDWPVTAPMDHIKQADQLTKAFNHFLGAMEGGLEAARLEASRRIARRDAQLVANDPRPTRLGNLRAQIEDYCQRAYAVEFEYLWPRLRMGVVHDETVFEPVEQAETQLNFALMTLLLVAISGAGWLAYHIYRLENPWAIALIGLAVPVLNLSFYLVVVESQRLLVTSTKAAIDRLRLDLLVALHVPFPKTYVDERIAWVQLQNISLGQMEGQAFSYQEPKA